MHFRTGIRKSQISAKTVCRRLKQQRVVFTEPQIFPEKFKKEFIFGASSWGKSHCCQRKNYSKMAIANCSAAAVWMTYRHMFCPGLNLWGVFLAVTKWEWILIWWWDTKACTRKLNESETKNTRSENKVTPVKFAPSTTTRKAFRNHLKNPDFAPVFFSYIARECLCATGVHHQESPKRFA